MAEVITISAALGDCALSPASLPDTDRIIGSFRDDAPQFFPSNLSDYLRFLELLILYDRLLVLPIKVEHKRDIMNMMVHPGALITVTTKPKTHLELQRRTLQTLYNKQIVFIADEVDRPPEIDTPEVYVRKYLDLSPELKVKLEERKGFWGNFEDSQGRLDEYEVEDEAVIDVAREFGVPFMISEFCRIAGLPYYLSDDESKILRWADDLELRLRGGVLRYLKEHLDRGAAQELDKLSQLGVPRVFPSTPIASTILNDAHTPDDLLLVALQLRDEFSAFRQQMQDVEKDLYDENVSVRRKLQISEKLKSLANQLWPKSEGDVFKETLDLTGLLGSVVTSQLSIASVPKLIKSLVSSPLELLKKSIRQRKIRVLLKAKRRFLETKSSAAKIAQVFSVSDEIVKEGLGRRATRIV